MKDMDTKLKSFNKKTVRGITFFTKKGKRIYTPKGGGWISYKRKYFKERYPNIWLALKKQ